MTYDADHEFGRIINIVREDKNVTAEVIVRLMYEYGLHIGEVLGITNEDITEKNVDGELKPVIYIRNRASDNKKYQSAKTLMKADSSEAYNPPNYKQQKLGYDIIYLTEDFYELLCDYIESVLVAAKKYNRAEKSVADKVKPEKHTPENHYIFLNGVFTPLSSKSCIGSVRKGGRIVEISRSFCAKLSFN